MRSTAKRFSSRPSFHGYPLQSVHSFPRPPPPPHSNFIIELTGDVSGDRSDDITGDRSGEVEGLLRKWNLGEESFSVYPKAGVFCRIFFRQWVGALGAMVKLWGLRLEGRVAFVPRLESEKILPSDYMELRREIGALIVAWAKRLTMCEAAMECRRKMENLKKEEAVLVRRLARRNGLKEAREFVKKKDLIGKEWELMRWRLEEFEDGIECLCGYVEGRKGRCGGGDGLEVFFLEGEEPDWCRVHSLMSRECTRLSDGLPIYGFRRRIVRRIRHNQVTILIGETGSGKSTQLVQFLVDSGTAAHGSVVCAQPRKIAALSLTRRVAEETIGCYEAVSVTCHPTYSSRESFTAKIAYTTDHCLLQHYMRDEKLTGISCILIDEAHERSLNTDLLLASIKKLLPSNPELRLVIMSATADSCRLSEYFPGSSTFHISGRTFPVDIIYRPAPLSPAPGFTYYVSEVLTMVAEIHRTQEDGTVLAFLTSQAEVEYACDSFSSPSAVSLPLHGKLLHEEQIRVFQDYPGKRKVIFSTNIAETSLTIPGVRYVIDPGVVKDSRFEPGSGMNILRVFRASRSSAEQRAGRAGRTHPGKCYRLYSKEEYAAMPAHQEPEIRRVHLGIAVLRILSLKFGNIRDFDFLDAPSSDSVELAIRNLLQLGAVRRESGGGLRLTEDGRLLVKMGIEPRLGKLVLNCFRSRLGREGLVLASVMANSRSIFCRVGSDEEKLKADRHKVQFCHRDGDLFTLLSVYRKWVALPPEDRNQWCWDNSINGKTMRRCRETVIELERCLEQEINKIIPTYWLWNPESPSYHDGLLKEAVLSSLSENVAMYSGRGRLGYEVAGSRAHVQLHPSCSLLSFAERPGWVVFGEILSSSPTEYLTCVTAVDPEAFEKLSPPPLFDPAEMGRRMLKVTEISGLGAVLLKKMCGRGGVGLATLVSRVREICSDTRADVDVRVEDGTTSLYSPLGTTAEAGRYLKGIIENERRWLLNECVYTNLYRGGQGSVPPVALLGAGAVIRHLELDGRSLEVQVSCAGDEPFMERDLLRFLEESTGGEVCSVVRLGDAEEKVKSVKVTFLTPEAAEAAVGLDGSGFNGSTLDVGVFTGGSERTAPGFAAVSAKVYWPRRRSNGFAIVRCRPDDVGVLVGDVCSAFPHLRCEPSNRSNDCLVISGLDKDMTEEEIVGSLRSVVRQSISDFHLVRGEPVEGPPPRVCEEEIMKEICPFLGGKGPGKSCCAVEVFPPEPKSSFMRGVVRFDERLHLEAAKALEQIEGKTLPGCQSWQTIKCQRVFNSFLSCPARAYPVIKMELDALLARSRRRNDVECSLSRNPNGSYRVKLSANATKTVAELRRPFEELMKGKQVMDGRLTPAVLQSLFSRDVLPLIKAIERATDTFIFSDRRGPQVRIFGSTGSIKKAESQLILSLLHINRSHELEIRLRGPGLPSDQMKQVVAAFGPDLHLLKSRFPAASFSLNTRLHTILVQGEAGVRAAVERAVLQVAESQPPSPEREPCPICLCEPDEPYRLESCGHAACGSCLRGQLEWAMRSKDGFPVSCCRRGCASPVAVTDLRWLLPAGRMDELVSSSLCWFVGRSGGAVRFCPSADCPGVYAAEQEEEREYEEEREERGMFRCGACGVETCRRCGTEYHPWVTCERYKEFKDRPELSLYEWQKGRENVKTCPVCNNTIEKADGCNHVECRCGNHLCWTCLAVFCSSQDCYTHLTSLHGSIT